MTSVLYLTANPNRASSNVPTEGWFTLLPKRGLQPVLVSHSGGAFCDWARSRGVPSHVMPLPVPNKHRPWEYLIALWRLRQIVRSEHIRLIHAIEQNVYPIAGDLARLCGLPAVVGVHCRMNRGFAEWAFKGRRQPTRMFFLTSSSRDVCRPAVEGVVPESHWRLLPNGLNLDIFRPDPVAGQKFRAEHRLGNGLLIGAASWLRPGKQLEHLFRIAAELDAVLVLAGGTAPGEEDYAKRLLADAQHVLGFKMRYVGFLDDLRGFYNALDLYVNTSKEETCSISIIESLACGCPVVGYPSVSVHEQLMPDGGEVVSQDDWQQLAQVVSQWLASENRRMLAREAARRQAEDRYDIQKLSDQLWDEYLDVLAAGSELPKSVRELERRQPSMIN